MNNEPRPLYDWEISSSAECLQGRMVQAGQDEGVKETLNVRYVGDMQRVEVKPGDRFVLKVDENISDALASRLREQLLRWLGADAQVIVLSKELSLGVLGAPVCREWCDGKEGTDV